MRQSHRIVVVAVTIVAVAVAAPVLALRGSLPTIDGRVAASGLTAPVTVERDALGVPTIAGSSRNDVAYATGYVHAQDRYFQMDLSRRMPAGRLAELVGDAALPTDRRNRLHRFEALADRMYAALPKGERELIDAYSAGVNAGLESLRVRPFEYLLLRSRPVHWQPRDTVLVVFAMYLQLNDSRAETDLRRGVLKASLPPALFSFVNSVSPEWEAPIDGQVVAAAPMPGADVYDLREHAREFAALTAARDPIMREAHSPGSNNWALGGGHTASGRGLVASDMHLGLGVPNTWYRARLKVQGLEARDLAGLTLPGSPVLVAGSNGRVAWALTNSYGDYSDLVRVELAPDGAQYRSAAGFRPLIREREVLRSSSGASEVLELRLTEWGPLLDEPAARGALAAALDGARAGRDEPPLARARDRRRCRRRAGAGQYDRSAGAELRLRGRAGQRGLDAARPHPAARLRLRPDGPVGLDAARCRLARLPGAGAVSTRGQPTRRPDLDREQPRRRRGIAGADRRRLAGSWSARAADPRRARPARGCDRAGHARDPARRPRPLSRAVAEAPARGTRRRRAGRTSGPRRAAQGRCHRRTASFCVVGRLPARAALSRAHRAARVRGIDRSRRGPRARTQISRYQGSSRKPPGGW